MEKNIYKSISVIVPTYNEQGNIKPLVEKIHKAFKDKKIEYEIIFVDDHSTDKTRTIIHELSLSYPITLNKKVGRKGKAFSIQEGIRYAQYEAIAMIDADLQYPAEAIPEMLANLSDADIIVSNRKKYHDSRLRKTLSSTFRLMFGKGLFGLNHDIQSGLKVFKREVIDTIKFNPTSAWTFDLEFLHRARQAGFTIQNFDIVFSKRENGDSKVHFVKQTFEIGLNAIRVKTKKIQPVPISSSKPYSMVGAGIGFKKTKYITHTTMPHDISALKTFTSAQQAILAFILVDIALGIYLSPLLTLQIIIAALSSIYFIDVLFNLYLIAKSLTFPQEVTSTQKEIEDLDERKLPIYTILCPLYREAHIIPSFLSAIEKLDWPKSKLDVLLLLEEDDKQSIEAVKKMNLPAYVRMIVVPDSMPKTKPKACNYGLSFAKGEYLVVYDAEDIPDPLQLKKAYLGFGKVKKNVICLQAKLNYYNPSQNLLTRFFTAEYSLWFDVTLTGLQSIDTTIPLGGTSNHFKTSSLMEVEGWDPFNVTEDADLGVRLFRKGYKTAIIDSTTLEEANSRFGNWLRQRSRWIKGYMQTYLVHTRSTGEATRGQAFHDLIFQLLIGGKIAFVLINPFLWLATIAYFALYAYVGPQIEALYPSYVFYMAAFSLVFGNFLFLYYYMIGVAKKGQWSLMKFVFLIPFYWLMISISAFIALYQLLFKPHYWEKTVHGLHLLGKQKKTDVIAEEVIAVGRESGMVFPKKIRRKVYDFISQKNNYVSGGIYVAAIGFGSFLNFVYSAYLGRVLSLEDFGLLGLISGFLSVITIIASSVGATVNYKTGFLIGKNGEQSAYHFWKIIRKKALLASILVTAIWVATSPFLISYFKADNIYPFLIFSPVLLVGIIGSIDRGLIGSRLMFISLAVINIFEPLFKLAFAILLVQLGMKDLAYSAIPVSTIAIFLLGWYMVVGNNHEEEKSASREETRFPWNFFIAALLSGISALAFLSADIILAKHFLSPVEAGKYALISLVGKMIYFAGALASPFITPLVSRNEGKNVDSSRILNLTLLATFVLTFVGFIGIGVFGQYTVPLLFGAKAQSVVQFLPIICFAMMCFTLSKVFSDFYLVKQYYGFSIAAFILGVIQIILISTFHSSLAAVVTVMSGIWIANLGVMALLHFQRYNLKSLESNFAALFGLFAHQPTETGKVKILIFNWRDSKHKWAGGAEVYVHELAKRWVKEGNSVTLFCGNGNGSPKNESINGVQIYRRGGFYTVYFWAFIYYMVKFRGKYDVIIDSENGIPFFTPLYAKERKFLLIHHVHQEVFRKSLKWPLAGIASFLEAKLMPIAYTNTQVITVSPSSRDEILKHKLTKTEPIIIYNGVDLTKYRPGKKSENPLILYVGRLQYYKSLHVFIKAAKEILSKVPDAEFVIAGEGEEKKKLMKFAEKKGIANKIKFLGFISEEKKISLFKKAWVFVNPSFMEGWGITTIEAAACGTPAVASNVPGLRDSIKNPHTGYLVEYGDAVGFSEKILKLIQNNKLRKEMSQDSIEWAKYFTWEKSSRMFYETLIEDDTNGKIKHPKVALANQ